VDSQIVLQKDEVAVASWIGLTALAYVTVLGITSNDFSQRLLGRAWKQVHGQGHTLLVLAVIHATLAVYVLEESRGSLVSLRLVDWGGGDLGSAGGRLYRHRETVMKAESQCLEFQSRVIEDDRLTQV
jgi:hypothetical protein